MLQNSLRLKQAYPPGEYFSVPNWPNVTAVNALGDFDLAMDKIAFIDGECELLAYYYCEHM